MAEFSFEQALQQIVDQAKDVSTNLSVKDKAKITKAGADVFADELAKKYKQAHYVNRQTGESPHLADSVITQNTNVDGKKDGSSTVGFGEERAYIANFIENGTRFPMYSKRGYNYKHPGQVAINGDNMVAKLREDPRVQEKMAEAEALIYKKIVDRINK